MNGCHYHSTSLSEATVHFGRAKYVHVLREREGEREGRRREDIKKESFFLLLYLTKIIGSCGSGSVAVA